MGGEQSRRGGLSPGRRGGMGTTVGRLRSRQVVHPLVQHAQRGLAPHRQFMSFASDPPRAPAAAVAYLGPDPPAIASEGQRTTVGAGAEHVREPRISEHCRR